MMSSVPYVPPDTMKNVAATRGQSVSLAFLLVVGSAREGDWAGRDKVLNFLSRPPSATLALSQPRTWGKFAKCRIRISVRDAREICMQLNFFSYSVPAARTEIFGCAGDSPSMSQPFLILREGNRVSSGVCKSRVLRFCQGHHGEPPNSHQRRIRKEFVSLDFLKRYRFGDGFSRLDYHRWLPRVRGVHGDYGCHPHAASPVARFINHQPVARSHLTQGLYGCGIGNAVPLRLAILLKVSERVL